MQNYISFSLISLMLYFNWACSSSLVNVQNDYFEYTSTDSVVFYSEYNVSEIVYGAIQKEENVVKQGCSLLLYLEFKEQVDGISTFRYFKTRNMCKGSIENLDFDTVFEDLVFKSSQYEVQRRFESDRLIISIPVHLSLP
ncbi:hypothetical protein [Croceimicrobium hydrocarbonivorans]|uniref:Lipoprotein n=1 Tax=Croceimicrobium hydrocarbonivorans TaxID=2761580 RepID=A0A7H0VD59_9FLAO|nr:hypothetical protein [Croceimicrobium hydrocarbonivorans]QNR23657.1 hypothetical protein H4K34_14935 [Croceimicrobium hydrocarbonivorans]